MTNFPRQGDEIITEPNSPCEIIIFIVLAFFMVCGKVYHCFSLGNKIEINIKSITV